MRSSRGDDADAEAWRQAGQRRVAFVVERVTMVGQLDADSVRTEPIHQIGQRPLRRVRAAFGERLAHMAFPASRQDVPVPAGGLGQCVEVVPRLAFLTAGQMGCRQLPGQPPVTLGAAGQDQQVRAGRVRLLGAGLRSQRQLGAEHGTHIEFGGRFGEANRPVQAVVVGERQCAQIQPGGFFDQFLRRTGPVEEAVRRMRMQLGIRGRRTDPSILWRLVRPALTRPGALKPASSAGSAATGAPAWRGLPSSTRSISAQLGGPLPQPMPCSLSNICSIVESILPPRVHAVNPSLTRKTRS
ncbi:hypothetical protein NIIDMKKI_60970 [Mycobacterium kansasii]|uniref:Uncharacterized protein n=1 Tax=Mycobacterium kansasii TaxID=1768 RepID=A0A7G1IIQ2_MYCKA|nr:hypothetical protein NIIDMKKI_60970 [Mycobacterium kansasii]